MLRALLLSPDDQAVNAITGVLEEMSVSCERPLDGMSAAQKLNSHNFDLVLVDCENLPAAKLIFDVCRRGKDSNNPVPIAIVDGRAGLPTAFRLGAELILTKPVAMDQARNTIRAAVARVRKEEPPRATPAPDVSSVGAASAQPEVRAQAAAAASTTTSVAAGTLSPQPVKIPDKVTGIVEASTPAPKMSAVVKDAPSAPAAATTPVAKPRFEASPKALPGLPPEPRAKLPDDPVLTEIDRTEKHEIVPQPKVLASFDRPQPKKQGGMVAVLVLALAGGGLYAVWMYQPGVRELVQPQIDRVMALAGLAKQPGARPHPAPVVPAAPPSAPATVQPAANSNGAVPAAGDAGGSVPQSAATPASPLPVAGSAQAQSPETQKTTPAAAASEEQSVANTNAVILSSKGAERRLVHQVSPVYPKEAKAAGLEGTVVLRTFVDDRGYVASVTLVEGNPMLADSATRAVKQWRYRPYARDGKILPFQTLVIVDFQRP
jgi:TonB family protein